MATGNRGTTFNYFDVLKSDSVAAQTNTLLYTCPAQTKGRLYIFSTETGGGTISWTWRRPIQTGVPANFDVNLITLSSNRRYYQMEDTNTIIDVSLSGSFTMTTHVLSPGDQLLFTAAASNNWVWAVVKEEKVA